MNQHSFRLAILALISAQLLSILPANAMNTLKPKSNLISNSNLSNTDLLPPKTTRTGLPEKQTELVVFPLSFVISGFELGIESNSFMRKNNQTFRFSAGYFYSHKASLYNDWNWLYESEFSEMESFRGEIQYRIYTRNFASPDNIFFGASAVYKTIAMDKVDYDRDSWPNTMISNTTINSSSLSLGILMGYRTRIYDIISMDFFFGGGFTPTNIGDYEEAHIDHLNPFRKSINLRAGITVGIRI